eukprot:Gregarina_sp_Pseudo_9__4271@NODE_4423_length_427_cov_28_226804_g4088_i0_p1_GENE_NODE_4423_length_427_cov_28_226804_g4088_i0NODE_4423_length_427_cov_28_226804_g4088_i0_p1_ORF_typecomplete_len121_score7_70PMEI/PF04043_15/0_00043AAA_13/PF13166_6/0_0012Prefoldin_3/PF13758_6/0_0049ApoLpIII/PF07464_11/0_033ApoLpIII/PF07464_11/2_9e02SFassemblin/PF06705_11/0_0063Baculo_PEP_C/PF04513_12/0_0077Apolipoprotein/PF01442_18/0_013NTase_sub_bind/PF08780_11/0_059NTase_sub_bind/PF08780_11/1_2e03CorA/PF01544_18/0_0
MGSALSSFLSSLKAGIWNTIDAIVEAIKALIDEAKKWLDGIRKGIETCLDYVRKNADSIERQIKDALEAIKNDPIIKGLQDVEAVIRKVINEADAFMAVIREAEKTFRSQV